MVKKSAKIVLEILAALIGFVILSVAALILWLVQAGPIHVPVLTDYIEQTINNADLGAQIKVDDTILTWAGWHRALDVRAVNLHIRDDTNRELAILPEMSIGLSTRALLRGQLAPTRIELIKPEFTVIRRADGSFAVSTGIEEEQAESSSDFLSNLIGELLAEPDRSKPTGYLRQVGIVEGRVTIKDRHAGVTWRVSPVSIQLDRSSDGVEGALLIESQQFGSPAIIEGKLHFQNGDQAVKLSAQMRGFDVASLGLVDEAFLPMEKTQYKLSGSIDTAISLEGALSPISFQLRGETGTLIHPQIFRDPLPIDHLALDAEIDLSKDYVAIQSFAIGLSGTQLSLSGTMKGALNGATSMDAELSLTAKQLTIAKLKAIWPIGAAGDAYDWIRDNITAGQIDDLVGEVALNLPKDGEIVLQHLTGTFTGSGLTVHYLAPMPPIEGGQVEAFFDNKMLSGQVLAGHVGDIKLESGRVAFRGLDEEIQFIDIEGNIKSSMKDALVLLDHPRLGYPSKLGLKPESASGQAEVTLGLSFPALKDLPFEKVNITTKAKLIDAGLKQALFEKDATDGQLLLDLDNHGMNIKGPVQLDHIPLNLNWQEFFDEKSNVARKIEAKTSANADQTASLGFDFRPFLDGESAFNLVYTAFQEGVAKLDLDLNLTKSHFNLPFLNWQKEAGDSAGGKLSMTLLNDVPKRIDFFSIASEGLSSNGSATFTKDGKDIQSAQFKRLLIGRTNLNDVQFARNGKGFQINLGQGIVDAVPLMKREKGRAKEVNPDKPETPYTIHAKELAAILMGEKENEKLTNVDLDLNHDPLWWDVIKINADVPEGKRFVFSYAPDEEKPDQLHRLYVETKDGGAAIRALGIYDLISGGQLKIEGSARHDESGRPLRGTLQMSSYRLLKQSFLTRFFTVASLTGVIDAITGEGILFTDTNATFSKTRDQTDIHAFQSSGPSIGITACGRVNVDGDMIDMNGTIAPAYILNGILDNIPLIGPILQGGEGKGAFAFTYRLSGQLSEPKIDVNPLSVLTPGFLRDIFDRDQAGCGEEGEKNSKVLNPQDNSSDKK